MSMKKAQALVQVLLLAAMLSAFPSLSAEQYQVKSASVPAPTKAEVHLPTRGLPPQDPRAELADREKRLQEHYKLRPMPDPSRQLRGVTPPSKPVDPTAVLEPSAARAIHMDSNVALPRTAIRNMTSYVTEPSVAIRGNEILYTGNWFASFSTDAGASYTYINPQTAFPAIPKRQWCCDQIAFYDKRHDLMIWFIQYDTDTTGDTERLAVAQGSDIPNQRWQFYEFTPQSLGGWDKEWLDFPDLVVSEKYLYITNNSFTVGSSDFTRGIAMRIPLDKLQKYQPFTYDYFDVPDAFAMRATQGATGTMYFADHPNRTILRVFNWPEGSKTVTTSIVQVQPWVNQARSAPGPDKLDWLSRTDPRITAAWSSEKTIGFAWTSAPDNKFPFQHVRVAILDKKTKAVIAQPHIWNPAFAFAYPAVATNEDGRVAMSVAYGGGANFPSHAIGLLDESNSSWELISTAKGTNGPGSNRWGDFLTIRRDETRPKSWIAAGFSLQNGTATNNIEPRLIRFSAAPPIGIKITLLDEKTRRPLPPGYKLRQHERTIVQAHVTGRGISASGKTVRFRTPVPGLLSAQADSVVTDSAGIAETTLVCDAPSEMAATLTAEADGITETATIPVQGGSHFWHFISFLLIVLSVIALLSFLFRHRTVKG